jgi:hypothetical protein
MRDTTMGKSPIVYAIMGMNKSRNPLLIDVREKSYF